MQITIFAKDSCYEKPKHFTLSPHSKTEHGDKSFWLDNARGEGLEITEQEIYEMFNKYFDEKF